MFENKKILIIGPTFGVGGVKTHVEQLVKLFSSNKCKVKVIRGHSLETFKIYLKFRPHVVIQNFSVQPKQILRIIVNRSIMFLPFAKHVLHLHGGRFEDLGLLINPIFKKLLTYHFNRYDKIFCLTEEQYATMIEITKNKLAVKKVFNYVEIPNRENIVKENDILNFLYIGRLTQKKGVMDAVEAIKSIKSNSLRLWIIGNGELKAEILRNKDPRIKLEGKKIGKEKNKYLEKADVFILPSFTESLPYAMLEASAYGAALIGTKVGAVDQILFNGINGFFIEPSNVEMLSDTINKFIQNPALANEMGNESYKICQEFFSFDHLKRIYDDLFAGWEKEKLMINNRMAVKRKI